MREVNRGYLDSDKPDKLKKQDTLDKLETIARTGNTKLISTSIYRDPYDAGEDIGKQSKIIDKLNNWYYGKCAYCERYYKLDVEHYRPKGEIRDENNVLISRTGYYWLCYEWSNLIPACISCNREGGKGAKFPYLQIQNRITSPKFVEGNLDKGRCQIDHNDLLNEAPILLHPETSVNFLHFFIFELDSDLKGITIVGIDSDDKGHITSKLCNLNREEIRRDRLQSVVKQFVSSIKATIKKLEMGQINDYEFKIIIDSHIQKMYDDCDDDELNHTLLRKFIVKNNSNFESLIIPFIPKNFQKVIKIVFTNFNKI